jgi:putative MATE family efflux protein
MSTAETTVTETARSGASWWDTVRESLSGLSHDYTSGSIPRAVMLLSVPMILEMAMESLFGILDAFWVGRLGSDAVAAVGVTESLITIVFAVALGLSMSTTAVVSRRIGENDPDAAADTAAQSILLGVLTSIPVAAIGLWQADRLLALMGAPEGVVRVGTGYARWMLATNLTIMLLFLINAIFRGAGDAFLAMKSLWVANAVNLVLDPLLIFGLGPFPELGLTGAAIGTAVGRGVGVLYQLRVLARGNGRVVVRRAHLRANWALMVHLVRISVGGTLQFLIATSSWIGLVRILTPFGSAALAGYTIALRIIIVAILPAWGVSNAAATLVGQNLGAGKPERAERSVWLTGLYNMAFLFAVMVAFLAWGEPMVSVFTNDPAARRFGADCLRIVSYGYVFYAWGMVMVQAFNGAGDTTTPTWINVFCYWMFQIPLAWTLARTAGYGPDGVFFAITIAESVVAVVAMVFFKRGRWKTQVV